MKLLFAGDIASPNAACSSMLVDSLNEFKHLFEGNISFLNLEGLFYEEPSSQNKPILFNHPSVSHALTMMNVKGVTLANNHTLDLPDKFAATKNKLNELNIAFCGAGISLEEAYEHSVIECEGKKIILIGCCWDILIQHQKNPSKGVFVNRFKESVLLDQVKSLRSKYPEGIIVVNIHWSFDLETAPFPLYRLLSKELITNGANVINGCHSHCIQGAERYQSGLIIYSPGNFYMPWYTFINGTLKLPEFAKNEMIVEWDSKTNQALCHFIKYDTENGNHTLTHVKTEDFDNGTLINQYSPYRSFDDEEFVTWYKKNRRKNILIPIYRTHREKIRNYLIDKYLRARIKIARKLAEKNLREWNN